MVDAFDVSGGSGSAVTRIEETGPAGSTLTLDFTGTAVSWISLRCNVCGIATVSIDGGEANAVDTAGAPAPGSPGLASEPVFSAAGLAPGSHRLLITVTGATNTGGAHVIVDAFDVTP